MWALLHRELLTLSRRPNTYRLRVLAAMILIGPLLLAGWVGEMGPDQGGELFQRISLATLACLALLTPLMASDCLSRERREDTLGLLFMTPLRPGAVVMAKALVHGLRALLLLLGAFPVMTVPLLLGGVSSADLGQALACQVSVIALGLAGAVLGSCRSRSVMESSIGAVGTAGLLYLGAIMFLGFITALMPAFSGIWSRRPYMTGPEIVLELGANIAAGHAQHVIPRLSSTLVGSASQVTMDILAGIAATTLASLAVLGIALRVAGWLLQRSWQVKPRTPQQLKREETFTKPLPLWDRLYRRWLRRHLDANPVGWLARRSVAGRLLVTVWTAVLAALVMWTVTDGWSITADLLYIIAWFIAMHAGAVAAGSFRAERENGALELLLVTPLSGSSIVTGRLKGLLRQLLPLQAILLILWTAAFLAGEYRGGRWSHTPLLVWVTPLAAMFVWTTVGLYCSMRCRQHVTALAATVGLGGLLPWIVGLTFQGILDFAARPLLSFYIEEAWIQLAAWVLTGTVTAVICTARLHAHLRQRKFAGVD